MKLIFLILFLGISFVFAHGFQKQSLLFFALGDWGGLPTSPYNTPVQVAVSKEMAKIASAKQMDFILALGDNFYYDGVKDVDDPRFNETYESIYTASSLHIPWFLVAGNHDYYGNVSAQLAYTKRSKRWFFTDFYYKKSFNIPNSDKVLDIVMVDTILLCGNVASDNVYVQPVLLEESKCESEKHWAWLEKTIKESKADYLLVCGHFPVYSIAKHGNTDCLIERLVPLLEKYNVSAYISGHDHNLQHIQPKNTITKVEYFVSGCTNFIDPSVEHYHDIPKGSMRYHWADDTALGAFAYLEATNSNMNVVFLQSTGKILYEYSFQSRTQE